MLWEWVFCGLVSTRLILAVGDLICIVENQERERRTVNPNCKNNISYQRCFSVVNGQLLIILNNR